MLRKLGLMCLLGLYSGLVISLENNTAPTGSAMVNSSASSNLFKEINTQNQDDDSNINLVMQQINYPSQNQNQKTVNNNQDSTNGSFNSPSDIWNNIITNSPLKQLCLGVQVRF